MTQPFFITIINNMNQNKNKPELLSPVRDMVSLAAAINAGADAVYFGVGDLNMRINSKGIELDKLKEVVDYAHGSNIKVYITLNSIIYNDELNDLDMLLDIITDSNADAVICWDMAVVQRVVARKIPFHVSTQASISNADAAMFYKNLGAERFVAARELSITQIAEIRNRVDCEIEVFCHGAMCVSVSGRCFISEFAHGRSANKGDCLQPCRAEYQVFDPDSGVELALGNNYVMSPKDLCTLAIIDKLIEAGVDSLKIEGRSRAPEYISAVTSAYRKAIDAYYDGVYNEELVSELTAKVEKVYNRGFSTGFLLGAPTVNDWAGRYGSAAKIKKVFCGKVINYFAKASAAYMKVTSQPLSVGDTIQVHGDTTGVIEFKVESLLDENGVSIQTADKCKASFPCPQKIRKNDDIYKIVSID